MAEQLANNAAGHLSSSISAGVTSLTLRSGEGAAFPASGPFRVIIDNEILLVGGRTGDTLTSLTRAQEGTAATTHSTGAVVAQALTVGGLTAYVRGIVTYATTLPASPVDGQEAILVDSVTNPTYTWRFRYNAGSTSPYKWEFVGGPAARVVIDTDEAIAATNAWVNCVTVGPNFVTPRAGEYLARFAARSQAPAGGASTTHLGVANASVSAIPVGEVATEDQTAASKYVNLGNETKITVTAGQTLRVMYFETSQLSTFGMRTLHVTPTRVA